jgi:hypothetical protein
MPNREDDCMRLMSLPEKYYYYLPKKKKLIRAKMFVKLATILEFGNFRNPDKIEKYIKLNLLEDDFEYMTIEELLLLRDHRLIGNSHIYELFPEEFDYLDGIPVLMWDEL